MSQLITTAHDVAADNVVSDCMRVMASAFDPAYGEAWTESQLRGIMDFPGSRLVIGRLGDKPVGFGLLRSIIGEAELLLLAVEPAHRGSGYGRLILEHCMTVAMRSGAEVLFLEVREHNPALSLYLSAGFTEYNRRKNYYCGSHGDAYDALSFSLFLQNR